MESRKWRDLAPREKKGIVAAGVVQVSLLVAALADLRGRKPEELRGSKRFWVPAVFVNFVGPIAYFLFGRRR
jgi:hypothetical protein